MILKYDIYIEQDCNRFTITQLIPTRKQWKIHVEDYAVDSLKKYFIKIQEGISDDEYKLMISQEIDIVKKVDSFLKKEKLLSFYNEKQYLNSYARRQLEVFDSWSRSHEDPIFFQKKLELARVLVIGAGGVGSSLINYLIRCGIGTIIVVDFDIIEYGNLARQCFYDVDDVGQKKVDVLASKVNRIGLGKVIPIFEKMGINNIGKIIKKYNVDLVTGLTLPTSDYMKNLYYEIFKYKIPIVSIGEHDVGPLFINKDQVKKFNDSLYKNFSIQQVHEDKGKLNFSIIRHPSYLPEIGIMTAVCADEIIKYISGYTNTSLLDGCFGLEPHNHMIKYHKS